jgi:hypothetical protein
MDKQTITSSTSTTGATGALTVSASNKGSKLSLTASGLTVGQSYVLGLNGTPTTDTSTANSKGDLKINTPLTSNVLDLNTVTLTDTTSSAVVLTFTLP